MKHKHVWRTNFVTIDHVDHVAGMLCECGKLLSQDEVENLLNKLTDKKTHSKWLSYTTGVAIGIIGIIIMAHS